MHNKQPLQWRYPVLLWLTTTGVTPVLMVFIDLWLQTWTDAGSEIAIVQLYFVFGLFFSLPAFLFFLMVFHSLRHSLLPVWILKLIFVTAAMAGMWVTLSLIGGSMILELRWLYGAAVLITGLLLPTRAPSKKFSKTE